jgi:hypothetical protein
MTKAYEMLVGTSETNTLFTLPICGREDNIKVNLKESEGVWTGFRGLTKGASGWLL